MKRILISFLFCGIALGCLLYLYNKPITVTGDEAAQEVAEYIKALSYDKTLELSHVNCDDFGVCSDGQRGDNPSATLYWRLLALSKVAPSSKEFRETFDLIKKDPEPNYRIGLWLTYRALKETNSVELADHWVQGMMRLLLFLKTNEQTLSTEKTNTSSNFMGIREPLKKNYPMILATIALELTDIIEALTVDEDKTKDNLKHKLLIDEALKLRGLKSIEWLEIAREILAKVLVTLDFKSTKGTLLFSNGRGDYSYESCWAMMVHARNWTVQKEQSSYETVEKFFQQNSFSTSKREDYSFTSAQMIFPCVMAARELQRDKDAHALMQFLFENLDSPRRTLCAGNDSFLSFYKKDDSNACIGNVKSMADTAWFTYLASGDRGQYILEKER